MEPQAHGGGRQSPTPLREEDRPLGGGHVSTRRLQPDQRCLEVGMQGYGAAAGLPFTGAVGHVHHLRDLSLRIGDHRPRQRRHLFGAEARFHRQEEHDTVARRIAGGGQIAENGPLLGEAHNLRLLPLHDGLPIALVFPSDTVTTLLQKNAMSL